MSELNTAVLLVKNQSYLNKFYNIFKKFNFKKILILGKLEKKSNKKNIIYINVKKKDFHFKYILNIIDKKINKDFFLFNSDYFINQNLYKSEKYFNKINKSLIFYEKKISDKIPPFSIINKKKIKNLIENYKYFKKKNQFVKYKKLNEFINLENSSKNKIKNYFSEINKKTIFLDRDGVINKDYGYVGFIKDFSWIPGAKKTIKYLVNKNYNIFIITNQSGIARGFFKTKDVDNLHDFVLAELKKQNCYINEIFYSPYHSDALIQKYKKNSSCRKPGTRFYELIKNNWNIKHKNIYMIGDKITDIKFAKNCGIKGLLFNENNLFYFIKKFI